MQGRKLILVVLMLAGGAAFAESAQRGRFRGLDRDNDGVITRAEWRGNERSFRNHDWNNDGVLSGNEVRALDRDDDLGWDDATHEQLMQRRTQRMFVELDHNRDGWIDAEEWHGAPERFARLDDDGNGRVSRQEFLLRREGTTGRSISPSGEQVRDTAAYRTGYSRGLEEGRAAGREDRDRRQGWDLDGQRELEQADSGYHAGLGQRAHYQAGYRAGFRIGYEQGFGPR